MTRFEPPAFAEAVPGSFKKGACSPRFQLGALDDVGLRINGPEKVFATFEGGAISPDTEIPLCIGAKLPSALFAASDDFFADVAVLAVDKRTGAAFTANLAPAELMEPMERPPRTEAELADSITTRYLTVDLTEYLDLPGTPATYVVHAEVADRRSNTIEIEVLEEE